MRAWITLVALLVPLASGAVATLGYDDARHLLARTGFGPTLAEIQTFAHMTREQAVERLLAGVLAEATTPPPAWAQGDFVSLRDKGGADPEMKKAMREERQARVQALRSWWFGEILHTPSPLTEKMTLFWHNHFVSSEQKVRSPELMYRQNLTLRRHGLARFSTLLFAIAKDPAMLIYLDGVRNRKVQPNENFAREVMELFTLGEGHYTEKDIKEAARAFTGWTVDPQTGEPRLHPPQHDDGEKTVLGERGRFNGDDVLRVLLQQPQTAKFIVGKLWREFVSTEPNDAEINRIAREFRDANLDSRVGLREILLSDAFYANGNRGTLIKSPVELVAGTLRQFDIGVDDALPMVKLSARMGQNLFAPPNVKGWPGGTAWINSDTLLVRKQFLQRLFRAEEQANAVMNVGDQSAVPKTPAMEGVHLDLERWQAELEAKAGEQQAAIERLVLVQAPVQSAKGKSTTLEFVRRTVLDPVYQLK
jgi:uncharacterized protein (DUF1800 family)